MESVSVNNIEFDIRKGNHDPNKRGNNHFLNVLMKRIHKYGEEPKDDIQSISIHDIKSFRECKNNCKA
jgi:hypothetical protein